MRLGKWCSGRCGQANDFNNGIQSVVHFIAFATKGDPAFCNCTQVGETVTFNLLENGATGYDNYLGIFAVEVVGVDSTRYSHAEKITVDPPQGDDLVSSGPMAVASPAFVLAVLENADGGASDTGGSGSGGPAAGPSICQQGALFFVFDEFTPLATFAAGLLKPTAGTVTAYFDAAAEPQRAGQQERVCDVGNRVSARALVADELRSRAHRWLVYRLHWVNAVWIGRLARRPGWKLVLRHRRHRPVGGGRLDRTPKSDRASSVWGGAGRVGSLGRWEVGFDGWALVPRLIMLLVLGLLIWNPWVGARIDKTITCCS